MSDEMPEGVSEETHYRTIGGGWRLKRLVPQPVEENEPVLPSVGRPGERTRIRTPSGRKKWTAPGLMVATYDDEQHREVVKAAAKAQGISQTEWLRRAAREKLARHVPGEVKPKLKPVFVPKPTTLIDLTLDEREHIHVCAAQEGISAAAWIRAALAEKLILDGERDPIRLHSGPLDLDPGQAPGQDQGDVLT